MDIENLLIAGLVVSAILNIVLYTKFKNAEVNNERRKLLKYRTTVISPEKDEDKQEIMDKIENAKNIKELEKIDVNNKKENSKTKEKR